MNKRLTMIEQAELKQANGTSYHGHTIKAKLSELKELFGEPFCIDDDKVKYDWALQTRDGVIFTIYDWRKGNFAEDQEIEWHIGGFNPLGTHKAKNLVEFELINLFAEEFLNNTE